VCSSPEDNDGQNKYSDKGLCSQEKAKRNRGRQEALKGPGETTERRLHEGSVEAGAVVLVCFYQAVLLLLLLLLFLFLVVHLSLSTTSTKGFSFVVIVIVINAAQSYRYKSSA